MNPYLKTNDRLLFLSSSSPPLLSPTPPLLLSSSPPLLSPLLHSSSLPLLLLSSSSSPLLLLLSSTPPLLLSSSPSPPPPLRFCFLVFISSSVYFCFICFLFSFISPSLSFSLSLSCLQRCSSLFKVLHPLTPPPDSDESTVSVSFYSSLYFIPSVCVCVYLSQVSDGAHYNK